MEKEIIDSIKNALINDGYNKDITSNALINSKQIATASFIAHYPGIFVGGRVIEELYHLINPNIEVNILKESKSYLSKGDALVSLKGPLQDILRGSRVASTILDLMCSIAYNTNKYLNEVKDLDCDIVANYKQLPGFSSLSKLAIEEVGGKLYNDSLANTFYVNDSHINSFETITDCINLLRRRNRTAHITIEARSVNEAKEAIDLGADNIVLIYLKDEEIKDVLSIDHEGTIIGASGNMSIGRIRSLAKMGLDYIVIDDLGITIKPIGVTLKVYKRSFK